MKPSDENTVPPGLDLTRLRNIGWECWDPIGLLGSGGSNAGKWHDDRNLPFADEYDRYLVAAALQLRKGAPPGQVVAYLVHIETQYMCLERRPDTLDRAEAVVAAILADNGIWHSPGGRAPNA